MRLLPPVAEMANPWDDGSILIRKRVAVQVAPNITAFNAVAGAVLLHLYDKHPTPVTVEPLDVGFYIGLIDGMLMEETVRWLEAEGFLRSRGPMSMFVIDGAQLTEKGLSTLLRPLPASEGETERRGLGELLLEAVASEVGDDVRSKFAYLVGRQFGA